MTPDLKVRAKNRGTYLLKSIETILKCILNTFKQVFLLLLLLLLFAWQRRRRFEEEYKCIIPFNFLKYRPTA